MFLIIIFQIFVTEKGQQEYHNKKKSLIVIALITMDVKLSLLQRSVINNLTALGHPPTSMISPCP